jgi:hypothetical protein
MRSPSVIEISGIVGTVVAELFGPDGELKARCEGHNLITQYGDQVVTERAAGIAGLSAPTGMRIGTGSTAAAKTGAGAAIVTKITGGNKAFDATYPQSSQNGAARRITWKIIQDLTHVTDRQFRADENRFAVVGRQVIDKADLGEHKAFVLRVRDQANKGKHGDELREWIVKNGPKAQEG